MKSILSVAQPTLLLFGCVLLLSCFSGVSAQASCSGQSLFINASNAADYKHCTTLAYEEVSFKSADNVKIVMDNLQEITGDLYFFFREKGDSSSYQLPLLTSVQGDVWIQQVFYASPEGVVVPSLDSIGGRLVLYKCNLNVVRFPALLSIGTNVVIEGGRYDMGALTDKKAFPVLQTIGGGLIIKNIKESAGVCDFNLVRTLQFIEITENSDKFGLGCFRNLTTLSTLLIENNNGVKLSDFESVKNAIDITTKDNNGYVNIEAFSAVRELGEFIVDASTTYPHLSLNVQKAKKMELAGGLEQAAFPALTSVSGSLTIKTTYGPTEILNSFNAAGLKIGELEITGPGQGEWAVMEKISHSFQGLVHTNKLELFSLRGLKAIERSFIALETVDGDFKIDTATVSSLAGSFGKLRQTGEFEIENTNLEHIDAFYALEKVESISVKNNAKLNSISGFCNLRTVGSSEIDMEKNTNLRCGDISDLFDKTYLHPTNGAAFTINTEDCNTKARASASVCHCKRFAEHKFNPCASNSTHSYCEDLRQGPICTATAPSSSGLSAGAVVGIVFGVLAVVAIVVVFFYRRRQSAKQDMLLDDNHVNGAYSRA